MNKVIMLTLIASSLLFNVSCRSDEVAAGLVGVGVGIGLDNWWGDGHHRRGFDHRRGNFGNRRGFDHHRRGHWGRLSVNDVNVDGVNVDEANNVGEVNIQKVKFADRYNISKQAAQKIRNAFVGARSGNLRSFASLGLTKRDLSLLARRELPDSRAIHNLAGKLDISEAQARDLLLAMNQEFRSQFANVNSNYWRSCMADGSWKTPQNGSCQSTSTSGCGPRTGATLCY